MKRCLFIGGSQDGECLEVDEKASEWCVAIMTNRPPGFLIDYREPSYRKERYLSKRIGILDTRYTIFVYSEIAKEI